MLLQKLLPYASLHLLIVSCILIDTRSAIDSGGNASRINLNVAFKTINSKKKFSIIRVYNLLAMSIKTLY
jgi:hypothetical protein